MAARCRRNRRRRARRRGCSQAAQQTAQSGGWCRAHRGGQGLDGLRREDLGRRSAGPAMAAACRDTGVGIEQPGTIGPISAGASEAARSPELPGPARGDWGPRALRRGRWGFDELEPRVPDRHVSGVGQRALRENGGDSGPADQEDDGREQSGPGWHSSPAALNLLDARVTAASSEGPAERSLPLTSAIGELRGRRDTPSRSGGARRGATSARRPCPGRVHGVDLGQAELQQEPGFQAPISPRGSRRRSA